MAPALLNGSHKGIRAPRVYRAFHKEWPVKVRIKATPVEREMDGVTLNDLEPGTVRNVSSTIVWWLIAQGYADPEMRTPRERDRAGQVDVRFDRRNRR